MNNSCFSVLHPFVPKRNKGLSAEEEDDQIEKEFVAEQLIKIGVKMDMSDNAGKNYLNFNVKTYLICVFVLKYFKRICIQAFSYIDSVISCIKRTHHWILLGD